MERLDDGTLLAWLREDAPFGDLTTRSLGLTDAVARMRFDARRATRVAAVEEAARLAAVRAALPEKKVVVETGDADEALTLAAAGADVLVSSAPYFAPPADVLVTITPVG